MLLLLVGCNNNEEMAKADKAPESTEAVVTQEAVPQEPEVIEWKLVTTWPKNFPGLGTGAQLFADTIGELSNGRLVVKLYGAGELVGALEVFDAVSNGTAQLGHSASYYWRNKAPEAQFFAAVPFGFTAQQMNAWIYHGGGWDLWKEAYAPFNLIPAPGGNTGVQMGGWFKKEINSLEDLNGLKMRIPGVAGEVLKRLGGTPVLLPGGEIFQALQSGTIDATEWVGPYNDLAFGLYQAAPYYYYPGWHEPGTVLEVMINKPAFEALPADLQAIVMAATKIANQDMLAEFNARNGQALKTLINEHGVQLRQFPDEVLIGLREVSKQVLDEQAAADPAFKKVYDSYLNFASEVREWDAISEQAYAHSLNVE